MWLGTQDRYFVSHDGAIRCICYIYRTLKYHDMNVGAALSDFYKTIARPKKLPKGVELLFPFEDQGTLAAIEAFYGKFFNDEKKRVLMLGINPGRFGGGVTGIPFTDPEKLSNDLGIDHNFDSRGELSSQFIYEMIHHLGGPEHFYSHFLISSVCPLGFVKEGKNLNYYDIKASKLLNNPEQYDCHM